MSMLELERVQRGTLRPADVPTGAVLYHGPARYGRGTVVVIATGLRAPSTNSKTGPMLQTYILVADESPTDAVKSGADRIICGDCPFRPALADDGPACYVNKGHGPLAVWNAWTRGRYPELEPYTVGRMAHGRGLSVRLGTYGDPGLVPVRIWRELLRGAGGRHTGYTHQWRRAPWLQSLCMASVETPEDMRAAHSAGWRTFRVASTIEPGEIVCPASEEAGKRTRCADCGLCDGARPDDRRKSIVIAPHGGAIALERARIARKLETV